MFCVICKQAYDWETLAPQVSNTNPEYHSWIATHEDDPALATTLFDRNARGPDGLTRRERYMMLANTIGFDGGRNVVLSRLCIVAGDVTRVYIEPLVDLIPTAKDFEDLRIAHLVEEENGDETWWETAVGVQEIVSFVLQHMISELDKFCKYVIDDCVKPAITDAATTTAALQQAATKAIQTSQYCKWLVGLLLSTTTKSSTTAAIDAMLYNDEDDDTDIFPNASLYLADPTSFSSARVNEIFSGGVIIMSRLRSLIRNKILKGIVEK